MIQIAKPKEQRTSRNEFGPNFVRPAGDVRIAHWVNCDRELTKHGFNDPSRLHRDQINLAHSQIAMGRERHEIAIRVVVPEGQSDAVVKQNFLAYRHESG